MKAIHFAPAVLFVAACAGTDTRDTSSGFELVGGEFVEVQQLDLTAENRTFVVAVSDDGSVAPDLTVRGRAGQRPLTDWIANLAVAHSYSSITSDDGQLVIITNIDDINEGKTPEELASDAREQANMGQNCPEQCLHCPEDSVFLCQTLCSAQH